MSEGATSGKNDRKRRFAAFISYAHADAAMAAKLQSRLERYRLPRHIADTHAEGRAALGQIFRDREDLAAAPSLSDAIRAAIAEAEALIVICSPEAKASRWVGEEIALFRQLHPDRPVLAALVRGEPGDAFPAALTGDGIEPLAADLRREGDGEALGFLKIIAGIAGVPLDALVQRDAQRRLRRVMWITAGALAAMLVMGVMTTLAIQARNEAARQRAEAEGLVEYMLTDLRDKLRGVGRPELMNGVNQKAMNYYKAQGSLSNLLPDSLERRARVLHAMGEDYDNSNKPELALASFREAHKATETLLAKDSYNPDRIFAHAQSEYWVGQAAWRKRDRETTTRHWQGYLAQAQKLLALDKDQARANLEIGYAFGNLCELYLNDKHDLQKAIDGCRRSIAHEVKAAEIKPGDHEIQMALANRYGWLADALLAQKSFDEARSARASEQRIVDRLLAKDPKNFELRFRQLWPQFGQINIGIEEGQKVPGAGQLVPLAKKLEALSNEAPDNMEVKRAWLRALYVRAKALIEANGKDARRSLTEAKALLDRLARTPSQREALSGFVSAIPKLEQQHLAGG
jgi:MTH538 TIR-like domain (DUF1863)